MSKLSRNEQIITKWAIHQGMSCFFLNKWAVAQSMYEQFISIWTVYQKMSSSPKNEQFITKWAVHQEMSSLFPNEQFIMEWAVHHGMSSSSCLLVILGRPDRFLPVSNTVSRIRARVIWTPYLEILTFLAIFTFFSLLRDIQGSFLVV